MSTDKYPQIDPKVAYRFNKILEGCRNMRWWSWVDAIKILIAVNNSRGVLLGQIQERVKDLPGETVADQVAYLSMLKGNPFQVRSLQAQNDTQRGIIETLSNVNREKKEAIAVLEKALYEERKIAQVLTDVYNQTVEENRRLRTQNNNLLNPVYIVYQPEVT